MLDIIILYFLTNHIGSIALKKGEPKGTWKFYTILAWILGGILGIIIGLSVFSFDQGLQYILIYYPFAIAGYHIVRNSLQRKPDLDDIDSLGNHLN